MAVTRARRKVIVLLSGAVVLLAGVWFGLSCLSAVGFENRWTAVQVGMSKAEVEEILGSPVNVYPAQMIQSNSIIERLVGNVVFDSYLEKWAYGRRRSLRFEAEFPYVGIALDGFLAPEPEDYVLYFSSRAEVAKKVHPYRNRKNVQANQRMQRADRR